MKISDVKLQLTQTQYCLLIALSQSIPRVLDSNLPQELVESPIVTDVSGTPEQILPDSISEATVDLRPEVRPSGSANGRTTWSKVDVFVSLDVVKLHLYDERATTEDTLREHGIARFALNASTLRAKLLSDGSTEAEVVMKSFTMSNTRPGSSKFREIIPAAQHNRNQVMILYTSSGGANKSDMAIVTVDSPKIIFAVEPIIGLLDFFTSAFPKAPQVDDAEEQATNVDVPPTPSGSLSIRLDLHDVSVSVLENDADPDSRAIRLSIKQVFLSQQVSRTIV